MSLQEAVASPAVAALPQGTVGDSLGTSAVMEESVEFNPGLPFLAVTHEMPDTDSLVSLWFIDRFLANNEAEVRFVRAGERLPISDGTGYNVIHVDTGFGRFDQHGKKLERASSFMLLAEHFGYSNDPGLKPIIELTRATDNVESVDDCSVHNVFKALRGTVVDETGKADWPAILSHINVTLNSLYSFHTIRAEGIARFEQVGHVEELKSGVKLAILGFDPKLRDAAFRKGADVVLWFNGKGKNGFYVGAQVRKGSSVKLGGVVVALRKAEAARRNVMLAEGDSARFGTLKTLPTWFIHQSNQLVASGTNGHPLAEDEYTKLSQSDIRRIVRESLSAKN